tara:strand:+ start:5966 stop:6490 length:525 start_codon:yes stop_codon:yes gene_type:complete
MNIQTSKDLIDNGFVILEKEKLEEYRYVNSSEKQKLIEYAKLKIRNRLMDNYLPANGQHWKLIKEDDDLYICWARPDIQTKEWLNDNGYLWIVDKTIQDTPNPIEVELERYRKGLYSDEIIKDKKLAQEIMHHEILLNSSDNENHFMFVYLLEEDISGFVKKTYLKVGLFRKTQ